MYDIGRSKRATRAYSLDDIALIPSRRTRGTEMVNLEWRIDALTFDFPIMAAPMDSVMSLRRLLSLGVWAVLVCSTLRVCGPVTRIPPRTSRS
ncbi:inosine-5'-monophosphate dehydrogenase [Cutibacterium acnes JCM 18909]|nr:inosine-5'-monophosphate dehydrogenase [Cutibacterium acnes JCM 18909]